MPRPTPSSMTVATALSLALTVLVDPRPVPSVLAQERDWSAVEIRTEKVADGVYMLAGAGGNIGVSVGADGVFLIDDQFAPLSDKIKAAVAALSDKPIRFLLNTHWHGDHVGGNENFAKAGVVIVAHDNVRKRLGTEQISAITGRAVPALPHAALPILTFSDTLTFHMNGDSIVAHHLPPAHTDGDAIVRFTRANVVHMGDCLFNGRYPVIDAAAGGSIDGMIAAADRVLPTLDANTRLIPGHGPIGDRASLEAFRDMMIAARDRIAPLVRAGKSVEEIVAARPTAELDGAWGADAGSAARFVRMVVAGMRRGR